VRAQGGAMDELGELIPVERTLAEEILQSASWFNEAFWPAGGPPEDEDERRAVVESWVARIRGEPTATTPARRFEMAKRDHVAVSASLTEEAAAVVSHLLPPDIFSLTDEERCAVMAALAGRLPALRSIDVTEAQLHALVPVWREMAAAGRPARLVHLAAGYSRRVAASPLPPLGNLLPRLQSLDLHMSTPEHVASWCAMLAGDGAPALVDLTLPAPSRAVLPDEQAAMCVDVLRRQAGSLRKLDIQPFRMSAGAADALDAAIVALPHLVTLRSSPVQVDGGSVRVLGGRAPHLRRIQAICRRESLDPAACLTAWLRELALSVEQVDIRNVDVHGHAGATAPGWDQLAVALRALGGRPAFRTLSLSARDGSSAQWVRSVLSPPPDVAAAPVWPFLENLFYYVWSRGPVNVELDLRHLPRLRKIGSTLLGASTVASVMRSAVCRDVRLHVTSVSLTAADAVALTPKERLVAGLTADTADETAATLAGVVGGWPDLRELQLSGDVEVSEATQVELARALGHCTQLRELCLPFPLCAAAVTALADVLPRLPEVTRIEVGRVTTSSLLVVVHGLPGAACGPGAAGRTLQASVIGNRDPAPTTDDLRELGAAVAAATQRGWAITFRTEGSDCCTVVELLSQVQALALRRDWRDCIAPLCRLDVTPPGYTLQLRPCGLVAWERSE
jgi:hypothetical protein